jgi:hypothetical protein
MFNPSLNYIECSELINILTLGSNIDTKYDNRHLIVDVRDEDFAGGNIKGAWNLCSEEFQREDILQNLYDRGTFDDL